MHVITKSQGRVRQTKKDINNQDVKQQNTQRSDNNDKMQTSLEPGTIKMHYGRVVHKH